MGLANRWNKLVMECVHFVSYTTVINGKQVGSLTPSRGLRQEKRGTIQGVVIAKEGQKVANLFFADDSLFFYRAKEGDCREIVEILEVYKRGSG